MSYVIQQPRAVRGRDSDRQRLVWYIASLTALGIGLIAAITAVSRAGSSDAQSPAAVAPSGSSAPGSWLDNTTLLSVYGRGFDTAPILGRLGLDHSMADVARQVHPYLRPIEAASGRNHVRIALHIIYGLATPCSENARCLFYLDDTGADIVKQYILPAARRGWLVVLDDQLGLSNPLSEMQRLLARGYLQYDNVEVAFDPEFRTVPGQETPGVPIGTVSAAELNAAESALEQYAEGRALSHRKLLIVHEWATSMITRQRDLRADMQYVQPVISMDGIGPPDQKTAVYGSVTQRMPRRGRALYGMKLFFLNPYDPYGHIDDPAMSWPQIFGRRPSLDPNGRQFFVRPVPRVIILT